MDIKEYLQQHKNEFDDLTMSAKSDVKFEARLAREFQNKQGSKLVYFKVFTVAASIVLLFTVITLVPGAVESNANKTLMANLDNSSAGKRLEGVYAFSDQFAKEDATIIDKLIQILHDDTNANVKIATIDALLKFPKNEKIRTNLIIALGEEKTPLVQIKLIKAVSSLRENRAQKPLKDLINNKQTFPIVKSNATLAMNQLKQ